jgi:hypothetical protein
LEGFKLDIYIIINIAKSTHPRLESKGKGKKRSSELIFFQNGVITQSVALLQYSTGQYSGGHM